MTRIENYQYRWLARGDVNAFFALALNNLTDLVIMASLLIRVFEFPSDVVLYRMIPGTALGVFLGNLIYSWLAFRLARRERRQDVCAMPLGINTPSIFVMMLVVVGPAYAASGDGMHAWRVGMAVLVMVGLFKLLVAPLGNTVRSMIPRAGLLGSLGGAGIILIAFLPLMQLFQDPITGFVSTALLMAAFVAKVRMPWGIPGGLATVLAGTAVYWILQALGYPSPLLPPASGPSAALHLALPLPTLQFVDALKEAFFYLPMVLPFALGTIIGGIDNTESAAAAGDEYSTNQILLTQGLCTTFSGFCGGVVETTPYIGHPAYKEMGARAGYTVGTALFVGLGAMLGFFPLLVDQIPIAAVAPILIYIGLQITAQAFHATPERHGMAVGFAIIPTLGLLVTLQLGSILGSVNVTVDQLRGEAAIAYRTLLLIGNGAIVTAVIWGAAMAELIDRRALRSALYFFAGASFSLFGVIHSPFLRSELFLPWRLDRSEPFYFAAAYLCGALVLLLAHFSGRDGSPADLQSGVEM